MAKKIYRTARGKLVDIDQIIIANEEAIAVGNMKVNARGDQLGPGGKIKKTRNKVMKEFYKPHKVGPMPDNLEAPTAPNKKAVEKKIEQKVAPKAEVVKEQPKEESSKPLRGKLAKTLKEKKQSNDNNQN